MKSVLKAGAAQVDITPPLGSLINGDFIIHYAQRIHDNLYAKALVLQNDDTTIAMVVVDICAMPKDFLDNVKKLVAGEVQIAPANIVISSTHTHYGGAVADLLMGAADLPYTLKLPRLIINAVKQAKNNLRPAKIAYGAVDVPEHVVCRRFFMKKGFTALNPVTGKTDVVKTNPFGNEHLIDKRVSKVDSELQFMAVKGTDEQWISLLANYAMHYVGDCKAGTVTADYFGQFAKHLATKLSAGKEFVGILSNGASGEASIWDFVQPDRYPKEDFEKSKLIGADLAEKTVEVMKDLHWENEPVLASLYEEVKVGTRKPSAAEVETARVLVETGDYENLEIFEEGIKTNDEALRRIYAREQVLLNEYPNVISFPVQAFRVGSGIIGALGGEFFAETGLWLKKNSSSHPYFTICLANGYVGYVPPAHEIEMGGYETWRCRTSFLEPAAEETIRKKLFSFIKQLNG